MKSVLERYQGNPILTPEQMPFECYAVYNAGATRFKGKYLLRIKPKDTSKYNELALKLEMNKNITDLFRIGEQYGLLAIVRVKNVEDYGDFIRELYLTEEIEDTFTNFVLDELKTYTNFIIGSLTII